MLSNPQVNTLRSLLFGLVFLGVAFTQACQPVPAEYKTFFSQDWERQKEQAKTFSIEKQIDYYLAGRKYVHPPSSTLLYVIAEHGKAVVPALMERMKNEPSDAAKVDLMEVIRNIHDFHDDLSGDKDVIGQLRSIISKIQDPPRKARAEELLTDIVENRKPQN